MNFKNKYFLVLTTAAVGIAVDQITKTWALSAVRENMTIPVIDGFFDLTLRFNTGAAFSLFDKKPALFFYAISALAISALFYFISQLEDDRIGPSLALGAILGGAIGNLADRIRIGSVVDFLLFYYRSLSWPAFNAADVFIVVGVFVFLFFNLLQGPPTDKKAG